MTDVAVDTTRYDHFVLMPKEIEDTVIAPGLHDKLKDIPISAEVWSWRINGGCKGPMRITCVGHEGGTEMVFDYYAEFYYEEDMVMFKMRFW